MIKRNLIKIDATGEAIGRLATKISIILRGKNKAEYLPYIDSGDIIEVANIKLAKFTGKKLEQKKYFKYSGYPGGLKTTKIKKLKESKPGEILKLAVKKMLPDNRLRDKMIKRLIIK
jgi:large subunit ribosomal protein L13